MDRPGSETSCSTLVEPDRQHRFPKEGADQDAGNRDCGRCVRHAQDVNSTQFMARTTCRFTPSVLNGHGDGQPGEPDFIKSVQLADLPGGKFSSKRRGTYFVGRHRLIEGDTAVSLLANAPESNDAILPGTCSRRRNKDRRGRGTLVNVSSIHEAGAAVSSGRGPRPSGREMLRRVAHADRRAGGPLRADRSERVLSSSSDLFDPMPISPPRNRGSSWTRIPRLPQ